MPFTLSNIKEDLEDIGPRFDGAPDLEFRAATKALELEQSALSYQRVPPGYRFPYGHTHMKQEEVYVVVRGSGRMKVDDEIVELKEWDAVRVPPGTWRGIGFIEAPVIGPANIASRPIVPPIAIEAASPTVCRTTKAPTARLMCRNMRPGGLYGGRWFD